MSYKLVISSAGQNLDDVVERFGRCQHFIISEIENNAIKSYNSLPNPGNSQPGGAGIKAAQYVVTEDPKAVIAVKFGMNAQKVLQAGNIDIYQASGTVEEAIMDYIRKNPNNIP